MSNAILNPEGTGATSGCVTGPINPPYSIYVFKASRAAFVSCCGVFDSSSPLNVFSFNPFVMATIKSINSGFAASPSQVLRPAQTIWSAPELTPCFNISLFVCTARISCDSIILPYF
ncbi:MAG: hypothetical protein PHG58_10900 [Clostridia bacterium]|nr:hypothetical protein [Clostridia bacterium]